ncbi:uncharacterized protein JN550_008113 [Neoarthrinium moseri]|uniref:uncharacterized protein n=1 Tax=Neoarthrinium moseri TaxID=1658444 RepID=UPI001FDD179E|nr:uncharacterized protein JN550_008113 [Neoarthrinium moseri]KAI1865855.1 hypothetical protein JN550_008113 [Neoarthrinium moseri]
MLLPRLRATPALRSLQPRRLVSTLSSNPLIKVFPNAALNGGHVLTYLDTNPPSQDLAIGSTTELPPTPRSFTENPKFMSILYETLAKHAKNDPGLKSQAQAFAGPGGATLGSGGAFFPQQRVKRGKKGQAAGMGGGGGAGGGGGGGASAQGGAGGGGVGGYVHLSDGRNPPDFGRIAWPEDILGSIEVNGQGEIVGEFESSGTYRVVTNEGILGLSEFLSGKVREELQKLETKP